MFGPPSTPESFVITKRTTGLFTSDAVASLGKERGEEKRKMCGADLAWENLRARDLIPAESKQTHD